MDFLDGDLFWDPMIPSMTNRDRTEIYKNKNKTLAKLHSVDYKKIGLEDYGKPGNYVSRQVSRWSKQYRASETDNIEAMNNLIDWLPKNIPDDDETTIVHGDYRLDNMILKNNEVVGILDWELSTLGHPIADFSYHCLSWRIWDFLWSLHIMDYRERDNINNILLQILSVLALVTSVSGITLFFVKR